VDSTQGLGAAFFDLDKTIIATSSTFAFTRPFQAGGLLTRRAMLRGAYAHFFYQANGADHDQMERMRRYLSRLVEGWDVQQVREIVAETLAELISPQVYEEATALIAEHHAAGREVVIVSASGSDVVEPIGAMLGADHVVATRMTIRDGRYSGDIDFYAYGVHKAEAVHELARERGYDLASSYAYSDSVTDVPMLATVGHPFAVNPDKLLRREARARGWPVLDFVRPVSLRARFTTAAAARSAAVGAGAASARAAASERVHRVAELGRQQASGAQTAVAIGAGAATAGAATAGIVWLAGRRRDRPTGD
jgi:HAD superfamily hydrolase (TIGR01490 family)